RRFLLVHYHKLQGDEAEARVAVRMGSEISGTLVGPEGAPLAKAKVRAVPQAYGFGSTTTNDQGEFRLDVLDGSEVDVLFDGWLDQPPPCEFCSLRAQATRI